MIRIEHLEKKYPNVTPLKDVNAEIRDGDVVSVIGPSGTGKSTLLRCINLLEKPTAGRIWFNETEITGPNCDISKVRQKMGMVFQSFNLFGHLTVIENIMVSPMTLLGRSRQGAYADAARLLRMVGLSDKALNYPDELSGGQKQRIAIARTLAMDPDVILLDEPTSALDPTMVGEVQAVIRDLSRTGKTMMIVTHEMNFARSIANRVFYMDDGGIYEDGTPEQIFDAPRREKTRRFIRKLKVLEMEVRGREYDYPGMLGELDHYCVKNQLSQKTTHRLQLVLEEMLQQLLMPALADPSVSVTVEYAADREDAQIAFRYGGPPLDVTKEGDVLSVRMLKSAVSEMAWAYDAAEALPNRVTLHIRNA